MNQSTIYALPGILQTRKIDKHTIFETVVRIYQRHYPELYSDGSITWVELYTHTRKAKISRPRMIVIALLRATHEWTLHRLGKEFKINNASAYYSMTMVKSDFETNSRYRKMINDILEDLYSDAEYRDKVMQRMMTIKV